MMVLSATKVLLAAALIFLAWEAGLAQEQEKRQPGEQEKQEQNKDGQQEQENKTSAAAGEHELSARELFRQAAGRLFLTASSGKASVRRASGKGSGVRPPRPTVESQKREEQEKQQKAKSAQERERPGGQQQQKKSARAERQPARQAESRPKQAETAKQAQKEPSGEPAPLGLRYSILKQVSGNTTREVSPDAVFHSGDRIRLAIESSGPAYLYIVLKGSSGNWTVLFPNPEIAGGDNRIEPLHRYTIPPRHWFAFDEQVGKERLFIMLSREPQPDLEELIYDLSAPAADEPGEEDSEEGVPVEQGEKVLMAGNLPSVDDGLVSRLRTEVYARDLVFEKVDEDPAEDGEKAVYVVNKNSGDDSRVIADVVLEHR